MTTDLITRLRKPGDEVFSTREKLLIADALERLTQSAREGWRYADELEQERKRLTLELAECKRDAMRLDWLGRQDERKVEISTDVDGYWYLRRHRAISATGYPSPRAMIDVAMKGENDEQ